MNEEKIDILLVEDNANDEMLALYSLRGLIGAKNIQVVRDGAEALDYAFRAGSFVDRASGNPQLILLDKKLPMMDGLEVLRRLRADPRTCLIPIVMMSGSSEESNIIESYQLGANSYIVKPVDFNKFTEVARELGYYWLLVNQTPPEPQLYQDVGP